MKKITFLKSLLVAACVMVGGNVTTNAQDTWNFGDTGVWGNMTSKGKSASYKEISTGSEVWFAPDGTTATSATSNVSFKFVTGDADGARFNYGGANHLGIHNNYNSSDDINYVKIIVPDKYRVVIEVHTGSSGRPMKVNLDGTETSYTADATYDYTNTTGNTQTIKVYATNAKGGSDWSTNTVKTITMINTQTIASHSWTANAVASIGGTPTTIKTYSSAADVMEGVDYTITVDKAIIYNEKCYVLNDAAFSANIYSKTYTMGTSAGLHTFNYEEVENFAFYGEAENIVSASSNGATEEGAFFSNGKGYRAQGKTGYVTLAFNVAEAGLYHIMLGMNNNNGTARGYNYAIDGGTVSDTYSVNPNSPSVLEVNQVLASGDHTITMNITYSRTPCFDYLLITKLGPSTVPVSVTADGYATLCPNVNLDFTSATAIEACKASVTTGGVITLTKVNTVKAGEGVLLRSISGGAANEDIPVIASADANAENAFVGIPAKIQLAQSTETGYTNYILSKKSDVMGFYKVNAAGSWCKAGSAYLKVADDLAPARGFFALDEEETTGICDKRIVKIDESANATVFDLQGRRVAQPKKGLYINNGRKVVIK